MFSKTILIAGAMLAASVSGASATTYQIAISGSCDTLTLTNSNGIVVGVSNAPSCDDSNLIGTRQK